MLNSLFIRNFRLFKELKIHKLARVNLFAGKNNVGKSCLLEAIQVYAGRANPFILYGLVSDRDEDWETGISGRSAKQGLNNPLKHLFHGYHFPIIGSRGIEIGPVENEAERIGIRTRGYQISEDGEKGILRRLLNHEHEASEELADVKIALELQDGGKEGVFLLSLSEYSVGNPVHRVFEAKYDIHILTARKIGNKDNLWALWDTVSLTDLESEVILGLQAVDPGIKKVAMTEGRIPIIRREGFAERIPLRNLGEGMIRLFHTILATVNAGGGFLLIDEFENGLHWSIQPKLWDTVFRLSEKLNVQVFATTHSKDCVRGFHEAWSCREDLGTFYRLDADPETGALAVIYSCETLSDALETDVEFR